MRNSLKTITTTLLNGGVLNVIAGIALATSGFVLANRRKEAIDTTDQKHVTTEHSLSSPASSGKLIREADAVKKKKNSPNLFPALLVGGAVAGGTLLYWQIQRRREMRKIKEITIFTEKNFKQFIDDVNHDTQANPEKTEIDDRIYIQALHYEAGLLRGIDTSKIEFVTNSKLLIENVIFHNELLLNWKSTVSTSYRKSIFYGIYDFIANSSQQYEIYIYSKFCSMINCNHDLLPTIRINLSWITDLLVKYQTIFPSTVPEDRKEMIQLYFDLQILSLVDEYRNRNNNHFVLYKNKHDQSKLKKLRTLIDARNHYANAEYASAEVSPDHGSNAGLGSPRGDRIRTGQAQLTPGSDQDTSSLEADPTAEISLSSGDREVALGLSDSPTVEKILIRAKKFSGDPDQVSHISSFRSVVEARRARKDDLLEYYIKRNSSTRRLLDLDVIENIAKNLGKHVYEDVVNQDVHTLALRADGTHDNDKQAHGDGEEAHGEFLTKYPLNKREFYTGRRNLLKLIERLKVPQSESVQPSDQVGFSIEDFKLMGKYLKMEFSSFLRNPNKRVFQNYYNGLEVERMALEAIKNPASGSVEIENLKAVIQRNMQACYIENKRRIVINQDNGFIKANIEELIMENEALLKSYNKKYPRNFGRFIFSLNEYLDEVLKDNLTEAVILSDLGEIDEYFKNTLDVANGFNSLKLYLNKQRQKGIRSSLPRHNRNQGQEDSSESEEELSFKENEDKKNDQNQLVLLTRDHSDGVASEDRKENDIFILNVLLAILP